MKARIIDHILNKEQKTIREEFGTRPEIPNMAQDCFIAGSPIIDLCVIRYLCTDSSPLSINNMFQESKHSQRQ